MPAPRLKQSKPVTLPQNPSKIDTSITPVPAPPLNVPGMQTGLDALKGLSQTYIAPPTNPYLVERNKSIPTPPSPADKQYKMGIGGRILGTAANFLSGFSGRQPVVYTGPGALSSRYYQDRQKWQTAHDDHETRLNDLKAIYDPGTPQPAQPQNATNTPEKTYKVGDTVSMGGRNHTVLETLPDGSMKIEPWQVQEEDLDHPMGPFYTP